MRKVRHSSWEKTWQSEEVNSSKIPLPHVENTCALSGEAAWSGPCLTCLFKCMQHRKKAGGIRSLHAAADL